MLAWNIVYTEWPQAQHKWLLASAHIVRPPKGPSTGLVAASLSLQQSISQAPPAQVATNCILLYSSHQEAPGQAHDGWHLPASETLPRASRTNTPGGQLQTTPEHHQLRKWHTQRVDSAGIGAPLKRLLLHGMSPPRIACLLWSWSAPLASQPLTNVSTEIEAQLQQEGTHNPHRRHPRSTWLGEQGDSITGHLLGKTTLPSLGNVAALLN